MPIIKDFHFSQCKCWRRGSCHQSKRSGSQPEVEVVAKFLISWYIYGHPLLLWARPIPLSNKLGPQKAAAKDAAYNFN